MRDKRREVSRIARREGKGREGERRGEREERSKGEVWNVKHCIYT